MSTGTKIGIGVAVVVVAGIVAVVLITKSSISSPVKVRGGSIYGSADSPRTWTPVAGSSSLYSTTSTDNVNLFTSKFTSVAPAEIDGTGGWVIKFWNTDGQGNPNADAVWLCSDAACSGAAVDANGNVYLKTPGDRGHWERRPGHSGQPEELHFHDRSNGCDTDDNHEGSCDDPVQISITTARNAEHTNGRIFPCERESGHGHRPACVVGVGKP
jgi:hypothetical protein